MTKLFLYVPSVLHLSEDPRNTAAFFQVLRDLDVGHCLTLQRNPYSFAQTVALRYFKLSLAAKMIDQSALFERVFAAKYM